MMKIPRTALILLSVVCTSLAAGAQDVWSLQRCIAYARTHNIQISQQQLQRNLAELSLQQSRLSQLPTLNASSGYGYRFGRSIDPTSNQFVNTQLSSATVNVSAGVTLFSWFQKRYTIQANQYQSKAAEQILRKMENDISLNVANAYLQILLAMEQAKVSAHEVSLTRQQLSNTVQQVEAGALPESNEADLEAQLARDSATYITNRNAITTAVIQMKALLNLDFKTSFTPEQPDLAKIPVLDLAGLSAEDIYDAAVGNQPQVLADSLSILAASREVSAARAALYPTLSLGAGLGTNYSSSYQIPVGTQTVSIPASPLGTVAVDGKEYTVNSLPQDYTTVTYGKPAFGKQLNNNLGENLALSLNIPLFNGWQARAQVKRSRIQLENQKLTRDQDLLDLKQDIYQAYNDAHASLENYNAAQKTLASSQTAFYYAQQRYQVGLINSLEYLTTQNNLFQAQTDLISKHYDYIFKMKVLEFYKNLNITL
jgi:outer membrane protein